MGTEKRERQKAQRAARLEAERRAAARAQRNRTIRNVVITGVAIIAVIVLWSLLSGCSSSASSDGSSGGIVPVTTTSSKGASSGATSTPPTNVLAETCPKADGSSPRRIDFRASPPRCIDPAKAYTAVFATSKGDVTVALDTKKTPNTVNNFVFLARYHYFDGTRFFRTEANTGIIQGGSPHTEDNTDLGPGYTIKDEGTPFPASAYGPGTLAMANTGQPNSGGAQFFFLATDGGKYLGDPTTPGAGSYAVFGKVTKGLDALVAITKLDSGDGQGTPTKAATIRSVTITAS